jgi:hypothetical protein
VLFSLWGYSRTRNKSWSDLGLFAVATGAVGGFFIAIFAAFAPQYLGMFRHLLVQVTVRTQKKRVAFARSAARPRRPFPLKNFPHGV